MKLKIFIPLLHKLYYYILRLSPKTLRYILFQTNIYSDYHFKIFIFTQTKFKFAGYINENEIKNMLNIVLNMLDDQYFKYNLNFEITFYYANKKGTLYQLSQPFIFNLHSQLDVDGVYEAITWNKYEKINSDIIIIVNIL